MSHTPLSSVPWAGKSHFGGLGLPQMRGNFFTAERLVFSPDTGSGTFPFSVVPSGPGPLQGVGTKWLNSNTCQAGAVGRREDMG